MYKERVEEILGLVGSTINGSNPWDIQVHDERFYKRALSQGTLGIGESYMDGWWDCKRLDILESKIMRLDADVVNQNKRKVIAAGLAGTITNRQKLGRAKRNAQAHYDIGNDLYVAMLGPTMAYSCAYWKDVDSLDAAQNAKYDLICRKLQLKPGMKLLDVGCGWGGLLRFAAENYGVEATGITPAKEQVAYIREKVAKDSNKITVLEQDYREPVAQKFDRIASVGMFEHVGPKNYRTFFKHIENLLIDDGLFLLHTIASNKKTHYSTDPWTGKYIFPGGRLPSTKQMAKGFENIFLMEDWHNFGAYYDNTLMAWHKNFIEAWPQLNDNYDERFKRMWEFYLLSFAGIFRSRRCNLWQIVLSKNGLIGGYESVR